MTDPRAFAVQAHGDQRYGTAPYVTHLDHVVRLLKAHGFEHVLAVGYLHDVLEDTAIQFDELAGLFGHDVASAVAFCSDADGPNRKVRKARTYARMAADVAAGPAWLQLGVVAKVADRLANAQASAASSPRKLQMYRSEHPVFRKALFIEGVCDPLWAELDAVLQGPAG